MKTYMAWYIRACLPAKLPSKRRHVADYRVKLLTMAQTLSLPVSPKLNTVANISQGKIDSERVIEESLAWIIAATVVAFQCIFHMNSPSSYLLSKPQAATQRF